MASYVVNDAGYDKARALIDARQQVLRSRWADTQPSRAYSVQMWAHGSAEWSHEQIELAAHALLQHLDSSRGQ